MPSEGEADINLFNRLSTQSLSAKENDLSLRYLV